MSERVTCPVCSRHVSIYGKMVRHNTTPTSAVQCLGSALTADQAHPAITQAEVDAIMDVRWTHYRREQSIPETIASEHWQVTVRVPLHLPVEQRHELFAAVTKAVAAWEPADRDGWDADVSGAPAK